MHAHAARPPRSAHASVGLPHHFALGLGLGLDDLTFRALSFILRAATPPAVPTAEAPKIFATSALAHMGQGMSCSVGADRKSVEGQRPAKKYQGPFGRSSRPRPARWRRATDAPRTFLSFARSSFHRMVESNAETLAVNVPLKLRFPASTTGRKIAPPGERILSRPLVVSRKRASREARHNRPDFPKSRRLPQTAGRVCKP